jgi:subtilase family serine protease
MSKRSALIRSAVQALVLTPMVAAATGYTEVPLTSRPVALSDQGVADSNSLMSAAVVINNPNEAAFDAAVAARYDVNSENFHHWMSDAQIASFAPPAADSLALQSSLRAQGFEVTASDDPGVLRVTGTAAQFQTAFAAPVHRYTSSSGKTYFRLATTPSYQGGHAELIAAVAGVGTTAMQPKLVRQIDFATGQVVAPVTTAPGSSPLASFTDRCFDTSPYTATLSGFSPVIGGLSGAVTTVFTGPTYLDTTNSTTRAACGYTVSQLVEHYGINTAHSRGLTGRNQTIVIVDAYGSPTLAADVNTFSTTMSLPPMDTNSLKVVYPGGAPTTTDSGWATETTLDVQFAHAFAPDAKIVVVVAPTNDDADLASAVAYAASHHLGNVISNSYGEAEADADISSAKLYNHVFRGAAARGIAVNVATGDEGDFGVGTPVGAASIPADSAWGTGVGGTSINVPSDNGPVEAVWGINVTQLGLIRTPLKVPNIHGFIQGSGGGESTFIDKPGFQWALPGQGRQLPDISALADPQTGAIFVESDSTGTSYWSVVGGTSLATPIFSAIWALADQAAGTSLGQAAPVLGILPPFAIQDILPIVTNKLTTSGTVTFRVTTTTDYDAAQILGIEQTQPTGFVAPLVYVGTPAFEGWNVVGFGTDSSLRAGRGWDNATGYGVPNGIEFIESAAFFGQFNRRP